MPAIECTELAAVAVAPRIRAWSSLHGGRILAAGDDGEFVLAALEPDGELDRSYSRNGVARTAFFDDRDSRSEAHAMALQRDGKVVLAGFATERFDERFALARFRAP